MNRKLKRPRFPSARPEGLEPRSLLSIGLNSVMELGEVSRAVALKGVEVAAPIPSGGSITFAFGVEASGNYLLEVRHVGEGLTLEASGPAGSASINPGPAGPFSTIALPLKAGDYQIKASAVDDQPVFVDWELLLTSGVGQSAAIGSTLASSAGPVALTGPSGLATPSAPGAASPAISSASWGSAVAPSLVAVSTPVGRSDPARTISPVGPTSINGAVALAHVGNDLPAGALKALVPVAEEPEVESSPGATSLLALEALGDARSDLAALGAPNWLDHLAETLPWKTIGSDSPDGPGAKAVGGPAIVADATGDPVEEEPEVSVTQTASPGLIATGVVLASAARRWRIGRTLLPWRRKSPTMPDFFPPSRG